MDKRRPYVLFREPGGLTDDTPVMGIPGRVWDAALTSDFVSELQRGNRILTMQFKAVCDQSNEACIALSTNAIFASAVEVFGDEKLAKAWMFASAIGLNQQKPIDLCETQDGRREVMIYLKRLKYGIYC